MILTDLTEVYVYKYTSVNNYGEMEKEWHYKNKAYLNIQQDVNELDRKSTGEVDYTIINARTQKDYSINKGDGISFKKEEIPEYIVTACPKVGKTRLYKLEKNNVKSKS